MRLSDQFQHEDEAAFLSVANLTSAVPLPPKVGTSEIQSLKDYELCRDDGPARHHSSSSGFGVSLQRL